MDNCHNADDLREIQGDFSVNYLSFLSMVGLGRPLQPLENVLPVLKAIWGDWRRDWAESALQQGRAGAAGTGDESRAAHLRSTHGCEELLEGTGAESRRETIKELPEIPGVFSAGRSEACECWHPTLLSAEPGEENSALCWALGSSQVETASETAIPRVQDCISHANTQGI